MALSGSLTFVDMVTGSGLYESISINVPEDEDVDSVFYDYRGTKHTYVAEIKQPVSYSVDDAYLKVTSIQIWPPRIAHEDTVYLESTFRIYGSEASRSSDVNNYVKEGYYTIEWDPSTDTDPYQVSYDLIKSNFPNDTLTDV